MSQEIRTEGAAMEGPGHYGRKDIQPSARELREYRKRAAQHLAHHLMWFEQEHRDLLGAAFGEVVRREGLTCYACAVLRNHAHFVFRKHRMKAEEMADFLCENSRQALSKRQLLPAYHPLWSSSPCVIYKDTPEAIRAAVDYVAGNPPKHGLPPQSWGFVVPYDGWPFHKRRQADA